MWVRHHEEERDGHCQRTPMNVHRLCIVHWLERKKTKIIRFTLKDLQVEGKHPLIESCVYISYHLILTAMT